MIDKDAQRAADRFMEKLTGKGFTMDRLQNSEDDYDAKKQERDSRAVAEFTRTKMFQDIMGLR